VGTEKLKLHLFLLFVITWSSYHDSDDVQYLKLKMCAFGSLCFLSFLYSENVTLLCTFIVGREGGVLFSLEFNYIYM
jgi:hypothetical protein